MSQNRTTLRDCAIPASTTQTTPGYTLLLPPKQLVYDTNLTCTIDGTFVVPITVYEKTAVIRTRMNELSHGAESKIISNAPEDNEKLARMEYMRGHLGKYVIVRTNGNAFTVDQLQIPLDN